MDFAGDTGGEVGEEIHPGAAELVERDPALQRRMLLLKREHEARIGNAGAGERPDRPRGDGVDADAIGAEIDREVAHRCFERGLGDAHGVVVRHRPLAAIVGERHHGAAVRHQRRGAARHFGEGEARDHHGAHEVRPRGVGVAALELVLVGIGDGVDEEIDAAPRLADGREHLVDRSDVLDVARQHHLRADQLGERLHAPAERVALIGEGELGAVRRERARDAPRDRVIVRNPHHEAALALHQHVECPCLR